MFDNAVSFKPMISSISMFFLKYQVLINIYEFTSKYKRIDEYFSINYFIAICQIFWKLMVAYDKLKVT